MSPDPVVCVVVPLHVCVLLADGHELQGVGLGILPNLQKHLPETVPPA